MAKEKDRAWENQAKKKVMSGYLKKSGHKDLEKN
jgi:hypothetical protein